MNKKHIKEEQQEFGMVLRVNFLQKDKDDFISPRDLTKLVEVYRKDFDAVIIIPKQVDVEFKRKDEIIEMLGRELEELKV